MSPDLKLSQPNIAMNNWLCKHYGGVYLVYVHKKSATSCQNNVIYIHVTVSANNKIRRYRLSSWEVYRWSWIIMKHRYQHVLHINSKFVNRIEFWSIISFKINQVWRNVPCWYYVYYISLRLYFIWVMHL